MRTSSRLALAVLAAAAVTLGACAASTGSAGTEGSFVVPIEVENTLTGLAGSTVYIARSAGSGRRLLGPVESGSKRTFNYDANVGQYRLVARQGVGMDSIVSEQFRLEPGVIVQWSLAMNRLLAGTR